ncbi:VOC family protein [Tenacibaculum amylolyticum]|uniref:VOC family protein n=1 Tax=Tenacibaculum amylolyticum TaxID=104269 RepID=UPI0038949E53
MKVGHILYKVNDLEKGVEAFRKEGFTVEYGTKKNPYNAVIYFSEGPYLELIGNIKLPSFLNFLMKLFGKGKVVERIYNWHYSEEGLIAVCLENYKKDLEEEKSVLKKYRQKYFERNSKRLDVKNRLLKFIVLFPDELKIPFLMTYFNINPKPENYIHPNGIKKIKSISFGTNEELIPLINELCDDKTLQLFIGEGVKDLVYEKV